MFILRPLLLLFAILLFVPRLEAQEELAAFGGTTVSSTPSMLMPAKDYFYFVATVRDKNLLYKTNQLTRETAIIDSTEDVAHNFTIVFYSDSAIYYHLNKSYPFSPDSIFIKKNEQMLASLSGPGSNKLSQLTVVNEKLFSLERHFSINNQKTYLMQILNGNLVRVDSLDEISHLLSFRNELYVIGKDATNADWSLYKFNDIDYELIPISSFNGISAIVEFNIKNYKDEVLFISNNPYDKMWQSDGLTMKPTTLSHPSYSSFKEADDGLYVIDNFTLKKWNSTSQSFDSLYFICCIEPDYGILKGVVYGTRASVDNMNYELQKIDASGNYPLLDIAQGEPTSHPKGFVSDGNKIYFTAYHPESGREVWESDGTASGTKMISDIFIDDKSNASITSPQHLQIINGQLFCSAYQKEVGRELFAITQGSQELSLYKDINSTEDKDKILQIIPTNEAIFTFTQTGIPDSSVNIWLTKDGITSLLKERVYLSPYSQTNFSQSSDFPVINNHIFWVQDKTQLWTSDGTLTGTHMIRSLSNIHFPLLTNGSALYMIDGSKIWKSNADLSGLTLIPSNNFQKYDLFFFGKRLVWSSNTSLLWHTLYFENEEESGIIDSLDLVYWGELNHANDDSILYILYTTPGLNCCLSKYSQSEGLKPLYNLSNVNNVLGSICTHKRLYFAVKRSNMEIWTSDGTTNGTRAIYVNNNSYDILGLFQLLGDDLVFSTDSGEGIMSYDASADTVRLLSTMNTDIVHNYSPSLTIKDKLYFAGKNGNGESAIWRTDGTSQGTIPISNTVNLLTTRKPNIKTEWSSHCYELIFPAINANGEGGLWKWDYDFWENPMFSSFVLDTTSGTLKLNWGLISDADYPAKLFEVQRNEGNEWKTIQYIIFNPNQKNYTFSDTISMYGKTIYEYRIHVVSKYSCNQQYTEPLKFEGLPEALRDATSSILYPNPAFEQLTLYFPQDPQEQITISIYNMLGGKCQSFVTSSQKNVWKIDALSSGVYLLSYEWKGKKEYKKFVKE